MAFLGRMKKVIFLVIFLLLPVALIYTQNRAENVRGIVFGAVTDSAALFERALIGVLGGFSDFFERHVWFSNHYDELLRLNHELEKTESLRVLLKETQIENQQLRRVTNAMEKIDGPRPLTARVIGRSGAPLARTIQIDLGSADGVSIGDAIVGPTGALGQVRNVARYSGEVLLITDTASSIDVIIERSRAHGLVRGAANGRKYGLRVDDFDRLQDVQEGDVVVTSGVGGKFPAGVPVGRVLSVEYPLNEMYISATLEPFTDFSHLELVMVLHQSHKKYVWRTGEVIMEMLGQSIGQ